MKNWAVLAGVGFVVIVGGMMSDFAWFEWAILVGVGIIWVFAIVADRLWG